MERNPDTSHSDTSGVALENGGADFELQPENAAMETNAPLAPVVGETAALSEPEQGIPTMSELKGEGPESGILSSSTKAASQRPRKKARTAYFIFQEEKRAQVQAEVSCQRISRLRSSRFHVLKI